MCLQRHIVTAMESSGARDRIVHVLFLTGVIAKGFDGVMEVIGGLLLFVSSPDHINTAVRIVTQHELIEDPNDFVAHLLRQSVEHLVGNPSTRVFGAAFLLWHGVIKIALVWALLRREWWAYPVAMLAFGALIAYQLYRYMHTQSIWLLALSLLDMLVIGLTWLEYRRLKRAYGLRGAHHESV
jgi:uncharacterized membrane protein